MGPLELTQRKEDECMHAATDLEPKPNCLMSSSCGSVIHFGGSDGRLALLLRALSSLVMAGENGRRGGEMGILFLGRPFHQLLFVRGTEVATSRGAREVVHSTATRSWTIARVQNRLQDVPTSSPTEPIVQVSKGIR